MTMQQIQYREATLEDLEFLVAERLRFIKVNPEHPQYKSIRDNCRSFFQKGLSEQTCCAVLAQEDGRCIGTAVVFLYLSVPSGRNHTGKNAYITSVFVEESHRRQGIGSQLVRRIVAWAQEMGCINIMLTATEMGKPLYETLGFIQTPGAMLYAPKT